MMLSIFPSASHRFAPIKCGCVLEGMNVCLCVCMCVCVRICDVHYSLSSVDSGFTGGENSKKKQRYAHFKRKARANDNNTAGRHRNEVCRFGRAKMGRRFSHFLTPLACHLNLGNPKAATLGRLLRHCS